jgi:hypothetical protein
MARPYIGETNTMDSDTQRFHENSLFQADGVGNPICEVLWDLEISRKRSVSRRGIRSELHLLAEIVSSGFAVRATLTREARFNSHAITRLEVRNRWAGFVDNSRSFVTHH